MDSLLNQPPEDELAVYANLKDRELAREGIFIAEGRLLVQRLLASGRPVRSVLCLPSLHGEFQYLMDKRPRELRVPVMTAPGEVMESLCGFPFHRGVLAAAPRPVFSAAPDWLPDFYPAGRIVFCSRVADPFNLGGIIRSASALGWEGIILADGCGDHLSRGALRASMGAVFHLPWAVLPSGTEDGVIAELKLRGFHFTGAVIPQKGAVDVREFSPEEKMVLMLGNEGDGLSPARTASCDSLVSIAMSGREDSLNVGAAGGILMQALGYRCSASLP